MNQSFSEENHQKVQLQQPLTDAYEKILCGDQEQQIQYFTNLLDPIDQLQNLQYFENDITNQQFDPPLKLLSSNQQYNTQRTVYFIMIRFHKDILKGFIDVNKQRYLIIIINKDQYTFADFLQKSRINLQRYIYHKKDIWELFYSDAMIEHLVKIRKSEQPRHDAVIVINMLLQITHKQIQIHFTIIGFGHLIHQQQLKRILQSTVWQVQYILASLNRKKYIILYRDKLFSFIECQTQQQVNISDFYRSVWEFYNRYTGDDETIAVNHLSLTFITLSYQFNQNIYFKIIRFFQDQQQIYNYFLLKNNKFFLFVYKRENLKLQQILYIIKQKRYLNFSQYTIRQYTRQPHRKVLELINKQQTYRDIKIKLLILFTRIYSIYANNNRCNFQHIFNIVLRQTQVKPLRQIFYSIFLFRFEEISKYFMSHPYIVKIFMMKFIPPQQIVHKKYLFLVSQLNEIQKYTQFSRLDIQSSNLGDIIFLAVQNNKNELAVHFPFKKKFFCLINDEFTYADTKNVIKDINMNHQRSYERVEIGLYYLKQYKNRFKFNEQFDKNNWIYDRTKKSTIYIANQTMMHPRTIIVISKKIIKEIYNQKQVQTKIKQDCFSILQKIHEKSTRLFSSLQKNSFYLVFQMLVINRRTKKILSLIITILTIQIYKYFGIDQIQRSNEVFIKKILKLSITQTNQLQFASIIFNMFPQRIFFKNIIINLYQKFLSYKLNFRNILIILQYRQKVFAIHDLRNRQFIVKYPQQSSLQYCSDEHIYNYLQQQPIKNPYNSQNCHLILHVAIKPIQNFQKVHDKYVSQFKLISHIKESIETIHGVYKNIQIYQFDQQMIMIINGPKNINRMQIRNTNDQIRTIQNESSSQIVRNHGLIEKFCRFFGIIKNLNIQKRLTYQQIINQIMRHKDDWNLLLYPRLIQQFNLYRQEQFICTILNAYIYLRHKMRGQLRQIFYIDIPNEQIVIKYFKKDNLFPATKTIKIEDLFNQHARYCDFQNLTHKNLGNFLVKKAFVFFVEYFLWEQEEKGFHFRQILELMFGDKYKLAELIINLNKQHIIKKIVSLLFQFQRFISELRQIGKTSPTYLTLHTKSHCIRLTSREKCLYPEKQEQSDIPFNQLTKLQFKIGFHITFLKDEYYQLFGIFTIIIIKELNKQFPNLETSQWIKYNKNQRWRQIKQKLHQRQQSS